MQMNFIFFSIFPNKSFQLKSEMCSGGNHSKIRITGLAASNATGEKLPMFVIGKTKNPRCLKTSRLYHVGIGRRKKAGWTVYYLKTG